MRSLHIFMAERKLTWATRFNNATPMKQNIDTKAATSKPVRYSLLSLPAYAVECLPRLAEEMDAEERRAEERESDKALVRSFRRSNGMKKCQANEIPMVDGRELPTTPRRFCLLVFPQTADSDCESTEAHV